MVQSTPTQKNRHKKSGAQCAAFLRGVTSGCRVGCNRRARCDGRSCHDPGGHPSHRDGGRPNVRDHDRASDGSRSNAGPVGSNEAPSNSVEPVGNNVALAGSSAAPNNTCCRRCNKCHRCCSTKETGRCRPLRCSSHLRRNKGRIRQGKKASRQIERFGDTWRPPGPRVATPATLAGVSLSFGD